MKRIAGGLIVLGAAAAGAWGWSEAGGGLSAPDPVVVDTERVTTLDSIDSDLGADRDGSGIGGSTLVAVKSGPPPAPQPRAAPVGQDGPPTQSRVWVEEDFSSYRTTAELLRYPSSIFSGPNEDAGKRRIHLDSDAPPVGGQSMRYDFADRTGRRNLCRDYTIGRNIKFPRAVQEVWVDQWVKFDAHFETLVPSCRGQSGNGYKFIFGRCRGGGCGRYEIKIGNQRRRVQTAFAPGLEPPSKAWQVVPISTSVLSYRAVVDGRWHRWRQHLKAGPDGGIRVWFDDRKVYDSWADPTQANRRVTAKSIYGLALGRNLNQGPEQTQSIWWGRVRVHRSDPGW